MAEKFYIRRKKDLEIIVDTIGLEYFKKKSKLKLIPKSMSSFVTNIFFKELRSGKLFELIKFLKKNNSDLGIIIRIEESITGMLIKNEELIFFLKIKKKLSKLPPKKYAGLLNILRFNGLFIEIQVYIKGKNAYHHLLEDSLNDDLFKKIIEKRIEMNSRLPSSIKNRMSVYELIEKKFSKMFFLSFKEKKEINKLISVVDRKIILRPQHGDFCLYNIIVDGQKISFVDWDNYGNVTIPFFDFYYLFFSKLFGSIGNNHPEIVQKTLSKNPNMIKQVFDNKILKKSLKMIGEKDSKINRIIFIMSVIIQMNQVKFKKHNQWIKIWLFILSTIIEEGSIYD